MPGRVGNRGLAVGAEVAAGGVHFRVWAPRRARVEVVIERAGGESFPLDPEGDGHFSRLVPGVGAGDRYRYRLDGDGSFPDPASRFQPEGPHGPSEVVDPSAFRWSDAAWRGPAAEGNVLYELHVGTFTPEGSWAAAARELPALATLGVTVVEMMPVAEFPGDFGWGYDGVNLFAPTRLYGTPDDLRRFVDRAHALGVAVILDVVYNHLGPDGNYLREFAEDYFTDRYENEWGEALDFDGPRSAAVRELFLANAEYWIREFHLDGLRLDATQQIFDASPVHLVAEVAERSRRAAGGRTVYLVGENEPQDTTLVRPRAEGGYGLDALWNDDFHHTAMVAATGRSEAYYGDYSGSAQELASAARWGYLYQGQHYPWQGKPRGTPALDLPAARLVNYLQNHDQVANSAHGQRLHALTSPGRYRALTALLLLAPGTPLLFQGQEFAASAPFLYFADHAGELARRVAQGRAEFLAQFPSTGAGGMRARLPDPASRGTFERCRLDHAERESHAEAYALHLDLLRLRREDPVFRAQRADRLHTSVLAPEALLLRFRGDGGDDRLVLVNLGPDLERAAVADPIIAPPGGRHWWLAWSSEDPRYGGQGTPPIVDRTLHLPGHSAVVLAPSA